MRIIKGLENMPHTVRDCRGQFSPLIGQFSRQSLNIFSEAQTSELDMILHTGAKWRLLFQISHPKIALNLLGTATLRAPIQLINYLDFYALKKHLVCLQPVCQLIRISCGSDLSSSLPLTWLSATVISNDFCSNVQKRHHQKHACWTMVLHLHFEMY